MSIQRIHHIQITIPVTDTDQARHFYCEVLGLTEIAKPESLQGRGGFWVQLSNADVHIGVEAGVNRNLTKAHIAYEVDDLNAIRQKIKAANLPIKDSIPIPGYARFECRDPFGNRVEFIQPQD